MPKLSPAYITAACGLSYLLTLRVLSLIFATELARGGMDYVVVALGGAILFPLVWLLGMHLFNFILRRLEGKQLRIGFIVISAAAILAWHGIPGLFAIGVGIFLTVHLYRDEAKKWNDARALEQFDTHGS